MNKVIRKLSSVLFALLLYFIFTFPVSAQIYTTEKLITVDTGSQTLTVWEGGKVINQTKVSTGLWQTPTPKGQFRIYRKNPLHDMKGFSKVYGKYNHPDVPYSMYFYRDYAIHGAYWHNSFGRRASNGCVNVPVTFSEWIYNWAPNGTKVIIW